MGHIASLKVKSEIECMRFRHFCFNFGFQASWNAKPQIRICFKPKLELKPKICKLFHASITFRKPSDIREILHTMVQLGWRQSNADKELYTPLFAFTYLKEMHLIKHGETTSKWMKFNDDIFRTQDGFI